MTFPTFTPGQVLTASDVNTWLSPKVAIKTSDESVTSSTTLQNDDALVLAMVANAVYEFSCNIRFDAGIAGDFKFTWSVPASATMVYTEAGQRDPETNNTGGINSFTAVDTGTKPGGGAGVDLPSLQYGIVTTAGTAGNLQFQWAQNASSATATRVRTGSVLVLRRIS